MCLVYTRNKKQETHSRFYLLFCGHLASAPLFLLKRVGSQTWQTHLKFGEGHLKFGEGICNETKGLRGFVENAVQCTTILPW